MPLRRAPLVLLLAVLMTVLPACAKNDKAPDLGLRKVTLDLTFKAKGAPTPSLTQIINAQEPYSPVSQALGNGLGPVGGRASGPTFGLDCPTAPEGLVPEVPVDGTPVKPPEAGTYFQRVSGTYELTGPLTLKGAFLPFAAMEIANVTDDYAIDAIGQDTRTIEYDVIERNVLSTTTTHYQSTVRAIARTQIRNAPHQAASELVLVWSKTTAGGSTTTFTPKPPITLMQYGGEGADWTSAGMDQNTNTGMVVQGKIARRESIDVCGKMIDTFRVESGERVANPLSGYSSQTNAASGNVYNVATQFGGLIVRKIVDTTSTFTVNGAPATLVVNSTATVNAVHPNVKPKS